MEKIITYCGRSKKIACDEACHKAWGINHRPRIEFDENDEDDYAFLADSELGEAPTDPGTYEGGDAKPISKAEIPNKWCVRECERCVMVALYEEVQLIDFNQRQYNMPSRALKEANKKKD